MIPTHLKNISCTPINTQHLDLLLGGKRCFSQMQPEFEYTCTWGFSFWENWNTLKSRGLYGMAAYAASPEDHEQCTYLWMLAWWNVCLHTQLCVNLSVHLPGCGCFGTRWSGNKSGCWPSHRASCLHPPSLHRNTGITDVCDSVCLHMGSEDLNSGLHGYQVLYSLSHLSS